MKQRILEQEIKPYIGVGKIQSILGDKCVRIEIKFDVCGQVEINGDELPFAKSIEKK